MLLLRDHQVLRIVVCLFLTFVIAMQSVLASVVAHPLHDTLPHQHTPSHHLVWSPETQHAHAVLAVKNDTTSLASEVLADHCCHFHFGCGACLSGGAVSFDVATSPIVIAEENSLLKSSRPSSRFRPPIA